MKNKEIDRSMKERDILYNLLAMTLGNEETDKLFSRAQLEYAILESNENMEYRSCQA